MALQKPKPGENYGPQSPPFRDDKFAADYPNLTEYLFTDRWQDGSVRVTSTLSVFSDNGCIKFVLNDRDNNRSAFFSEETWMDTLVAIEQALASGRVDWKSRRGTTNDAMKTPF